MFQQVYWKLICKQSFSPHNVVFVCWMLYLGGKKSLFYGNRPKKMNVVGNSITELKSLNITIWKVFIKEFHLWCLCSPLFFVQCLICPLKLLCRIYSYMAFVLVFFVCLLLYQQLYSPWGKTREAKQPDPARSGFLDPEVSSLSWIIHYNI